MCACIGSLHLTYVNHLRSTADAAAALAYGPSAGETETDCHVISLHAFRAPSTHQVTRSGRCTSDLFSLEASRAQDNRTEGVSQTLVPHAQGPVGRLQECKYVSSATRPREADCTVCVGHDDLHHVAQSALVAVRKPGPWLVRPKALQ